MGGFFAVASKEDCVADLFYGTDYHSHLGTRRGGMAVKNGKGFDRYIHDLSNAQFRSKFEDDIPKLRGNLGVGVISDYEDQPLIIGSNHGVYTIVTVGKVENLEELTTEALRTQKTHFSELSGNEVNPTELISTLINQENSYVDGICHAQRRVQGSCSMVLLTDKGIYAARDFHGRTPVVVGKKDGAYAVTLETSAFPNLNYEVERYLGPGEVVFITPEGVEQVVAPQKNMQICSFLWVYYGYPSSSYEGINAEDVRNKCGAALARADNVEVDVVAGVPDSGIGHALGYAAEVGIPYRRAFVKYTPTWPRSFMPQDQRVRDLVARMKLIPVREMIDGHRLLFCEDSIVRGTQLKDVIQRVFDYGATEVHMRPACPPLVYSCKYLNFSRSKSELDLAARRAMAKLEDNPMAHVDEYTDPTTTRYENMVSVICEELNLTSLRYQTLGDMIESIGLPEENLCTYCWNGRDCGQ